MSKGQTTLQRFFTHTQTDEDVARACARLVEFGEKWTDQRVRRIKRALWWISSWANVYFTPPRPGESLPEPIQDRWLIDALRVAMDKALTDADLPFGTKAEQQAQQSLVEDIEKAISKYREALLKAPNAERYARLRRGMEEYWLKQYKYVGIPSGDREASRPTYAPALQDFMSWCCLVAKDAGQGKEAHKVIAAVVQAVLNLEDKGLEATVRRYIHDRRHPLASAEALERVAKIEDKWIRDCEEWGW